ncbi:ribosome assembly RNA-binding protein YhbY [Thiomicrorhabdus indica]|uniref:ribosome assembly RNA-binding protein YhbY n=1 Tax=Thiomicrorhabdus indica TaxID=2267253 RepID=UPI002AA5F372|nr:ribosome assembly RNA-binding protein YhbY [Thiomicrorhabdus indica]
MSKSNKKLTFLSNPQKKFLKGIAHNLNPMIIIGSNGVTDSLMAELETTLEHHELLKIKIAIGERDDRKKIVEHIIENTGALLVQTIGKTCVIFRQREKDSEFSLN